MGVADGPAEAKIELPAVSRREAELRAKFYDGVNLIRTEADREAKRQKQQKEYQTLLVDGPRLHLSSTGNFTFDPNAVFPMPGVGNVYVGSKLNEEWGILETEGPVLIGPTYTDAWVPAPTSTNMTQGPKWKLTLNPGWKVIPGKRKGDFDLAKS